MAININSFLHFKGNCRDAFEFYKNAFGGDFTMISTAEENALSVAENEKNLLVYIELPIGGIKLMGAVFRLLRCSFTDKFGIGWMLWC